MFTGIIQAIGKIGTMQEKAGDMQLHIITETLPMANVAIGDSIAVSGVCLTAIKFSDAGFWADVSIETINRTILKHCRPGSNVNLEKALTPSSHLGGHIVSGHVDGIGNVTRRDNDGRSIRLQIQAPPKITKYIAEKGSICVDGVSLTVNTIEDTVFALNCVPHTLKNTTLINLAAGQHVNLEVDLIARYIERLLQGETTQNPQSKGVTHDLLAEHGFIGR